MYSQKNIWILKYIWNLYCKQENMKCSGRAGSLTVILAIRKYFSLQLKTFGTSTKYFISEYFPVYIRRFVMSK